MHKESIFLDTSSLTKKMNSDKVKTICKWPMPMLAKEILSFLRFAKFCQNFVKSYLEITASFTKMTRKDIVFT